MSIYSKPYDLRWSSPAPDPGTPGTEEASRPLPMHDQEMARRRRLAPISEPLPATFRWMAKLPRNVRPVVLLRRFPRIANMMAGSWGDPCAFRAYVNDLLIDRRGNRKGFPPDVERELVMLRFYHDELQPVVLDVYHHVGKRT